MILVFKTNIDCPYKIQKVSKIIQGLPHIKWNVDLEDCDNILRIETQTNITKPLIYLLKTIDITCIEL